MGQVFVPVTSGCLLSVEAVTIPSEQVSAQLSSLPSLSPQLCVITGLLEDE